MAKKPRLELITLGEELLIGIRSNSHLLYLGEQLSRRGISVSRNVELNDDSQEIETYFKECWERSDIIITTGGLGPTSDDNTKEAIARALGLELEEDPIAREVIEKRFQKVGREMTDSDLKQCLKPIGAETIPNFMGTAPGIFLKHEGKMLFMLPGPSNELRPMFQRQVLPRLREEGHTSEEDNFIQLRTFGLAEGKMEAFLEPVLKNYEGIGLAFCTHDGIVDVRLSAGALDLSLDDLDKIGGECEDLLAEYFVAYGQPSMAQVVMDHLRATESTLAVAESCTGGLLSDAITNVIGASNVYSGGIISYSDDAKIELLNIPESILAQHGAVSAETAVAMATSVSETFTSDYAISITGFAGPSGGTPEDPVGTIYIGYRSPIGDWSKKFVFTGDRQTVKARAVNAALDFMRRQLNKYKLMEFLCLEEMLADAGIDEK